MRSHFPILSNLFGQKDSITLTPESADELENAIILAMLYISKNIQQDGRFVYRNSLNPKKKYSAKYYSSLRHAGTLYSMYLCERQLGKEALYNKRLLSSEYLVKNYIKKVGKDMYGLLSKPEEEAPALLATSGGTGLALIALSNLLKDNKISKHILEKMGNFLIFMQTPQGDFCPSFELVKKEKSDLHSARYYPGESCLGLLYLYEFDKQEKWLETAKKGLFRLAEKAEAAGGAGWKFDHWGMLAVQKLFATPDNALNMPQKKYLINFAERNIKSVIAKQNLNTRDERFGAFTNTRSLCGNATILEGLIAAYQCLDNKVLQKKVLYSIKSGVEFLSKHQVKTGTFEGGIPSSPDWEKPEAKNSEKEIRIDYVQHTISAWIVYKSIIDKSMK